MTATGIDRRPARLSRRAAGLAALVALALTGLYSPAGLAVGAAGALVLAAGLLRGGPRGRGAITLGAAGLFAGVLVAGAAGAPALGTLVGATAAVLAWDLGSTAAGVGAQLGRAAETSRLEATHLLASTGVGGLTVAVGYALFRAGTGGLPVTTVVFLALAAALLVGALR